MHSTLLKEKSALYNVFQKINFSKKSTSQKRKSLTKNIRQCFNNIIIKNYLNIP